MAKGESRKKISSERKGSIVEERPWGKFEVFADEKEYKVKRLTVYPKGKLSLQSHKHRSENWVVVRGTAKVINGDKEIILRESESTFIPVGNKHRLENPGEENVVLIEVQTGDYFGEDDIIRYEDIYNRL
jgi:mannose-1-phosphate guanylyltransferase